MKKKRKRSKRRGETTNKIEYTIFGNDFVVLNYYPSRHTKQDLSFARKEIFDLFGIENICTLNCEMTFYYNE